MHYDGDLKLRRRITVALIGMNALLSALNFWERHWVIAVTAFCWAVTCGWDLALLKSQQTFRENARIVEAGVRAVEERYFGKSGR